MFPFYPTHAESRKPSTLDHHLDHHYPIFVHLTTWNGTCSCYLLFLTMKLFLEWHPLPRMFRGELHHYFLRLLLFLRCSMIDIPYHHLPSCLDIISICISLNVTDHVHQIMVALFPKPSFCYHLIFH